MFYRVKSFVVFGIIAFFLGGSALAVNNGDVPVNTPDSARRMIMNLMKDNGQRYPGKKFLDRLDKIAAKFSGKVSNSVQMELDALIKEASLANPLLDFDKLLVIRRTKEANRSLNSYTSDTIKRTGWDNDIAELSNLRGEVKVRPIYRHPNTSVIKHMDVHFSGQRLMFSGVGSNGKWAVLEIDTNGQNLKELTPSDQKDVQWFDSCYLPEEGTILVCSTAGIQGLPCVNGSEPMVDLFKVNTNTGKIRQLTFEQDSDWHPRVLPNGRVMYLRWEYTDIPHYYSRYLFHMNPDGTSQREYWGSGSYFPTAYVWARPIPNHPTKVVGIASGHHAKSETGRLLIIDPALGRKYPLRHKPQSKKWGKENDEINIHPEVLPAEKTGCVQEIPGFGRDVVGNVYDNQGGGQKYTFGTPYPLSENYFLVSLQKGDQWVLALVDTFDNITVLYQDPKFSIFEPIPLLVQKRPPVLVDRTTDSTSTVIFCTDIYGGPGLKNIPRGKVKKLRVFAYHYGYFNSGGHESVGLESSWDIKRVLGTVDVEKDGSFSFYAPANTPLAIQPLDDDGTALALMRSWMVGMGGEIVSCNGCHENQNEASPNKMTLAARRAPNTIRPWRGTARPFAYPTEVQPILNKKCVGCHNDNDKKGGISFAQADPMQDWRKDRSYLNLVAFTRRPGPESDMDLYDPMEWHVSTSPLVQMFKKGHHNVELSDEDWDRLYTWIDLNVPHRGRWNNQKMETRRLDLAKLYAGVADNPEEEHRATLKLIKNDLTPVMPPKQTKVKPDGLNASGIASQAVLDESKINLKLAEGVEMTLTRIPAGEFVMGSQSGYADEMPRSVVNISKDFWMGQTEVTNKQFEAFDPEHDTRYLDENGKDHTVPGYIAN
ncbi:MAG: SUMF1/EgtB/PvdO family nonheme iron enzyme, partial [Phycisphaerae bacterium]|nr:SUMF1/EgtB/PvdO family nonheme iron enzyme [Phycisphaerae bacterium]